MKTPGLRNMRPRPPRGLGDLAAWALALLIAVGLWFFVNAGARTNERTLQVRLDLVRLPAGMVITNAVPDYVELRVSGTGLMLSSIDDQTLVTSLDLSGVRPGVASYTLNAKDFGLPRSVEVSRIVPSRVALEVDRIVRRSLPVRLDYRGDLDPGLEITETQLLPDKIAVSGPRSRLATLAQIDTEALDRASLEGGVNERTLNLLSPGGLVQLRRPSLAVQIVVRRKEAERTFEDVALEIHGTKSEGWTVSPGEVAFVVRGPSGEIESLELAPGAAYVDLEVLEPAGTAVDAEPKVTLPPGYESVRAIPATVVLEPPPLPAAFVGPLPRESGLQNGEESADKEGEGSGFEPPSEENP